MLQILCYKYYFPISSKLLLCVLSALAVIKFYRKDAKGAKGHSLNPEIISVTTLSQLVRIKLTN